MDVAAIRDALAAANYKMAFSISLSRYGGPWLDNLLKNPPADLRDAYPAHVSALPVGAANPGPGVRLGRIIFADVFLAVSGGLAVWSVYAACRAQRGGVAGL